MTAQTDGNGDDAVSRARIIAESLPYMLRYDEETVVVKYRRPRHGRRRPRSRLRRGRDVYLKLAGINPVVVHGGGPQIGAMLERLAHQVASSCGGLRVTDKATVDIVEMVLAGSINKEIVASINAVRRQAPSGMCGKDGRMVTARKLTRTDHAGPGLEHR
jgi:acetylglutamate kinase